MRMKIIIVVAVLVLILVIFLLVRMMQPAKCLLHFCAPRLSAAAMTACCSVCRHALRLPITA